MLGGSANMEREALHAKLDGQCLYRWMAWIDATFDGEGHYIDERRGSVQRCLRSLMDRVCIDGWSGSMQSWMA